MKKEDIFHGVTNIRDDLIDEAAKKRKRPGIWRGAVAAVLALTIAVGGAALWRGRTPGLNDVNEGPGNPAGGEEPGKLPGGPAGGEEPGELPGGPDPGASGTAQIRTLAAAQYPERIPYPTEEFSDDYDRWSAARRERRLTEEEREALSGFNAAAIRALLEDSGDGNAVCSPANIYLAFAMLAETAGGENRQQILSALGAESVEELRARAGRLWNALYNDDGSYTLKLANSLWLRDGVEYGQEPLDILARDYYASSFSGAMGSEALNDALRQWLNENTGDLLREQAEGVELGEDAYLALASTVYFADTWAGEFSKKQTAPQTFHAPSGDLERDFMHKTFEDGAVLGERFTAIELSFKTGGSMRLILPKEGVAPEELLDDPAVLALLAGESFGVYAAPETFDITLSLPKFDVSFDADIREAMTALGVTYAFDPGGTDFSPIAGDLPLYVSDALHAARVKIDEEGCEAAAYTVLITTPGAVMPVDHEDLELTFDRPFLFSVISNTQPVFTGIVSRP